MEYAIWTSRLFDTTPGAEKAEAVLSLRDGDGFTPTMRVRPGGIVEVNTASGWQPLGGFIATTERFLTVDLES